MTTDPSKEQQAAEIMKESLIEDEVRKPEPTQKENSEVQKKKQAAKKKKNNRILMAIGGFAFLCYAGWWLFKPVKADARYGVCYTLLELNIPYPNTLRVIEIRNRITGAMTMWFNHIDAFGNYRTEEFTCGLFYNQDIGGFELRNMRVNKVDVSDQKIASYNKSLIYINQNPRILNAPYDITGNLYDLHFDSSSFWNVQLNIGQSY